MKKLIVSILVAIVNVLHADPVAFRWSANPEANIAGYNVYVAPVMLPLSGEKWFVTGTRATVDMPPGYVAWLTALNTAGLESDPTYPLAYNPIIVELVFQGTKDLPDWGDKNRRELFRKSDAIFNSSSANISQSLSITKSGVTVSIPGTEFFYPQDSTLGKKFFRSYVAARPL